MSPSLDPDEMPKWIARQFINRPQRIIAGIDEDDCAVIRWRENFLVITTDFINANPISIELGIASLWDLGRLVVAANLSDLCGSGADPIAFLLAATLPHGTSRGDFKHLIRGVKFELARHKVPLVGGDSKLGKSRAIAGIAIGAATEKRQLFLKNGGRSGDIVWASGNLGSVAAAVWGFHSSKLDSKWRKWAKGVLINPSLPLDKSLKIAAMRLGRGGTDISDGLGADMYELCTASRVGCVIDASKIPILLNVKKAAGIGNIEPWRFAFASGGDFQFLVTTAQSARERMIALGLTEIGFLTPQERLLLSVSPHKTIALPIEGHRDARATTFQNETNALIKATPKNQQRPDDI